MIGYKRSQDEDCSHPKTTLARMLNCSQKTIFQTQKVNCEFINKIVESNSFGLLPTKSIQLGMLAFFVCVDILLF